MGKVLWYTGVVVCALGWGALGLLVFLAYALGGLSDGTPPVQDPSFWEFCGVWLLVDVMVLAALVWSARRLE